MQYIIIIRFSGVLDSAIKHSAGLADEGLRQGFRGKNTEFSQKIP